MTKVGMNEILKMTAFWDIALLSLVEVDLPSSG
jgi:hypothetical protein